MRDAQANASARVSAAVALLDRGWGKAEAKLTINDKRDAADYSRAEIEALLAESVARDAGEGMAEAGRRDKETDRIH